MDKLCLNDIRQCCALYNEAQLVVFSYGNGTMSFFFINFRSKRGAFVGVEHIV